MRADEEVRRRLRDRQAGNLLDLPERDRQLGVDHRIDGVGIVRVRPVMNGLGRTAR
jgi:hypothetical protein